VGNDRVIYIYGSAGVEWRMIPPSSRATIQLSAFKRHLLSQRTMTSEVVHNDNIACCTIPPVKSDYQPKGSIAEYAGISSYLVGDVHAKTALVCVYDIFGFVNVSLISLIVIQMIHCVE
jgi:hypothetical protein